MKQDSSFFKSFDPKDGRAKPEDTQLAQDFLKFEGNAQTQRLLSRLQVLADDFGLNLTSATLSASCKYTAPSNATSDNNQATKKHGYFASENDLIRLVRNEVGTDEARNPITYLVEAADDIVYSTVDVEDGVKKGSLDWDFLKRELVRRCNSEVLARVLEATERKIGGAPLLGKNRDEALAAAFRTNAIAQMVIAVGSLYDREYDRVMEGQYPHEILYQSDAGSLARACKAIAFEHVYKSPQVIKREILGRNIIFDLLDLYWEVAQDVEPEKDSKGIKAKIYSQISSNYRHVFAGNIRRAYQLGMPKEYFRMQLITDQVCGMTDSFAVTLHRELNIG